jgi:hypothetical protein
MKTEKRNNYNPQILQHLKDRYGFKPNYIRASIRGERCGTIPSKLKEEYLRLEREFESTLKVKEDQI